MMSHKDLENALQVWAGGMRAWMLENTYGRDTRRMRAAIHVLTDHDIQPLPAKPVDLPHAIIAGEKLREYCLQAEERKLAVIVTSTLVELTLVEA